MLTITGEVRKVLDHGYTDKRTGEIVPQAKLVLEPPHGAQNYEVFLTAKQVKNGVRANWEALVGKPAAIAVSLYVNHDYRFHKFTATGSGEPLKS